MGATQSQTNINTALGVLAANLKNIGDDKRVQKKIEELLDNSHILDLLPDRVSDVAVIILCLLAMALTVYVLMLRVKIKKIEAEIATDYKMLKQRITGTYF